MVTFWPPLIKPVFKNFLLNWTAQMDAKNIHIWMCALSVAQELYKETDPLEEFTKLAELIGCKELDLDYYYCSNTTPPDYAWKKIKMLQSTNRLFIGQMMKAAQ